MKISELIENNFVFIDGAMGTILQEKVDTKGKVPELFNIQTPEIIKNIHLEYLKSGSDIITTNTFGASRIKLRHTTLDVKEVVRSAVKIARSAVDCLFDRENKFVALGIGPLGKLMEPAGDLSFDEAYENFKEIIITGVEAGADLIIIETMSDLLEMKAAVIAAKQNCDLPIFCTMTFQLNMKTLSGSDVFSIVSLLESLKVDAIGINCGLSPEFTIPIIEEFIKYSSTPIIVQLNAGLPNIIDGIAKFELDAIEYTEILTKIVDLGVQIIGGCCGTTPLHIKNITESIKTLTYKQIPPKYFSTISTSYEAISLKQPNLRIENLYENLDLDNMIDCAFELKDEGANILNIVIYNQHLDVEYLIFQLQLLVKLPLQITTDKINVLEQSLKIYSGKMLINYMCTDNFFDMFKIVKKYGGLILLNQVSNIFKEETILQELSKNNLKITDTFKSTSINLS